MTRVGLLVVAVGLTLGTVLGIRAAGEFPRMLNALTVEVEA
jgi:hypothetical protein